MGVLIAVFVALAAAAGASARGGTTIAAAPIVRSGVHQAEDTNADATRRGKVGSATSLGCWMDYEYWRLPLRKGDHAVITMDGDNFAVGVFPAGTTDATIHAARSLVNPLTQRATVKFTAEATGVYPLVVGPSCYDGVDGSFGFVVRVISGG